LVSPDAKSGIWKDWVASCVLTKILQAVVRLTQAVAEWERVSQSFTGWGTIEIAK